MSTSTETSRIDLQVGDLVEVRSGPSNYAAGMVSRVNGTQGFLLDLLKYTILVRWSDEVHVRLLHRPEPDPEKVAAFRNLLMPLAFPRQLSDWVEIAKHLVRYGAVPPETPLPNLRSDDIGNTILDDGPLIDTD